MIKDCNRVSQVSKKIIDDDSQAIVATRITEECDVISGEDEPVVKITITLGHSDSIG